MAYSDYPEDQDIIIYGATGDLAQHRLWPALYNLYPQQLPQHGVLLGTSLDDISLTEFINLVRSWVKHTVAVWDEAKFPLFAQKISYSAATALNNRHSPNSHRLIYLSIPASAFGGALSAIKSLGLEQNAKIVIEKPFGHDLNSAQSLNNLLHQVVDEERIYRIDHYLGKEAVQNLLMLRFGNSMLQHLWNRQAVESVQITVAEDEGVEHRGHIYEESGAIRDVVQNHMMQLLALTCMTPPATWEPESIRDEKVKVLRAIQPISPQDVVLGQYGAGTVKGQPVPGYLNVFGVNPDSKVETYAALKCYVGTWDWAGIPFYLRTGKALCVKRTEIILQFRDVPLRLFSEDGHATSNRLTVRIQPDEGISLSFNVKTPGDKLLQHPAKMDFKYDEIFDRHRPEAYERLIHDVLINDHTLFIREDETEAAWSALSPLLLDMPTPHIYPAGGYGPEAADAICKWHELGHHTNR